MMPANNRHVAAPCLRPLRTHEQMDWPSLREVNMPGLRRLLGLLNLGVLHQTQECHHEAIILL